MSRVRAARARLHSSGDHACRYWRRCPRRHSRRRHRNSPPPPSGASVVQAPSGSDSHSGCQPSRPPGLGRHGRPFVVRRDVVPRFVVAVRRSSRRVAAGLLPYAALASDCPHLQGVRLPGLGAFLAQAPPSPACAFLLEVDARDRLRPATPRGRNESTASLRVRRDVS